MVELNLEAILSDKLSVSAGDKVGLSISSRFCSSEFEGYGSNASLLRSGGSGEGVLPQTLLSRWYGGQGDHAKAREG